MSQSFTLEELSTLTQSKLLGDPFHQVSSVCGLDGATKADVSFLSNSRYKEAMKTTNAGVICIDEQTAPLPGKNYLVSKNPSKTFQLITDFMIPPIRSGFMGIHPTAVIHPTARLGANVTIGPLVVIDQHVEIGDHTSIYPFVSIGPYAKIGNHCTLFSSSVVRERCILGDRVILQPSAIIGSCGFGYITDEQGIHQKIEQVGIVILEDDVEIGANSTVDRARFKSTIVSKGTKIDNLVQIGHNVIIGEHNIIVAQTGISGSSQTGKYVMIGGQGGVIGHVKIADYAQIATRGGVSKTITKAGQYGGSPATSLHEDQKIKVHVRNIAKYVAIIKDLEKKVKTLEEKLNTKTS